MIDVSLLLPTRNRQEPLYKLFDSIVKTTARPESLEIVLYIDEDDTSSHSISYPRLQILKLVRPRDAMGKVTNVCYEASHGHYIMLMNDDMVFRTQDWDVKVLKAASRIPDDVALLFGNDLYQKHNLAAFPILPRRTCELMNRVCPDQYEGGFIDPHIFDIFKKLAKAGHNRVIYLPEVVFEHTILRDVEPAPEETYIGRDSDHDELVYIAWSEERRWIAARLAQYVETSRTGLTGSHRNKISAERRSDQRAQLCSEHETEVPSPPVSIVICVDTDLQLTFQCLGSIVGTNAGNIPFELIIIDNSRTEEVSSTLSKLRDKITLLPNKEELSLPKKLNQSAQLARGDYVVFLPDDISAQPGWLPALLKAARDNDAAVVGGKLLNPRNGRVKNAGMSFFETDGIMKYAHNYRGLRSDTDAVNKTREVQAVSSIGMLVDKNAFLEAGGFDETLTGLEDIELCVKIRALGRKVIYAPRATIFHHGQDGVFQGDAIDRSWAAIVSKWRGRMEPDLNKLLGEDGFSLHAGKKAHYVFPAAEAISELKSKHKLHQLKELLEESLGVAESIEEPAKACEGIRNDLALLAYELSLVYSQLGFEHKVHGLYDLIKVYRLPHSIILSSYEQINKEGDRELGTDALANMCVGTMFRMPVSSSISKISVKMRKQGNPMDDVAASIYGDSGRPKNHMAKAVSDAIPGGSITPEMVGEWVTFTFPSPPFLSADINYWIILERLGRSDESDHYEVKADVRAGSSRSYASFYSGPDSKRGLPTRGVSLLFRVHGKAS